MTIRHSFLDLIGPIKPGHKILKLRNGAKLNLGDGMILSSALAQNINQPVIPTENENFSFKVPNQRPSVVQAAGLSVEHARAIETGHSSVASPTEMRLDPMGMDNFEG